MNTRTLIDKALDLIFGFFVAHLVLIAAVSNLYQTISTDGATTYDQHRDPRLLVVPFYSVVWRNSVVCDLKRIDTGRSAGIKNAAGDLARRSKGNWRSKSSCGCRRESRRAPLMGGRLKLWWCTVGPLRPKDFPPADGEVQRSGID